MTNRVPGRSILTVAAALFLLATAVPAGAQGREDRNLLYRFGSVGLIPGQSLRVTVVSLVDPPDADAPPNPDIDPCWKVALVDAEGRVLADSGDIEMPPGRTRSFTIERRKLGALGDKGTGRLQVRAVLEVENDNPLFDVPPPESLRLSVEVVSTTTGRTMSGLAAVPEPLHVQ